MWAAPLPTLPVHLPVGLSCHQAKEESRCVPSTTRPRFDVKDR